MGHHGGLLNLKSLITETTLLLKLKSLCSTYKDPTLCSWLLSIQSIYYQPNGVMLDMLSIKAGVQIHHWFKGPQHTVDSNKQQFELSIGRAVG